MESGTTTVKVSQRLLAGSTPPKVAISTQLWSGSFTSTCPKSYAGSALKWYRNPILTWVAGGIAVVGNLLVRYCFQSVSYTHLRAHETPEHLVCRLLLEKKK